MSFNSATKPADIPIIMNNDSAREDFSSKEQWEAIDKHLRQMNVWTEEIPSPLSTSPANRNAAGNSSVVTRAHSNQHNPSYRKSEGDIRGPSLTIQKPCNPPQSAPVLPEDFELKWEKENTKPRIEVLPESSIYPTPSTEHKRAHLAADVPNFIVTQSLSDQSNLTSMNDGDAFMEEIAMKDQKHIRHLRSKQDDFPYVNPGSNSPLPTLRSSASNPSMKIHSPNAPVNISYSYHKPNDSHPSLYSLPHQTSSPLLHAQPYKNSPSARRKSAPIAATGMRKTNYSQRSVSHSVHHPNFFPGYSDGNHNLALAKPVHEEEETIGDVNNDKEYTRALLQHQSDRMNRLKREIEAKKNELNLLYADVKRMEREVSQRDSNNKPPALPTVNKLQFDVGRLREINRRLKIDCNCMYKEVELFSRDGDSTSDDFYSRYNRPPSIKSKGKKDGNMKTMYPLPDLPPPPVPPPDEPKWRCSHCTFDNHAALNKCEGNEVNIIKVKLAKLEFKTSSRLKLSPKLYVVTSLDKMLHDDYLCLVDSDKQQNSRGKKQEKEQENLEKPSTPKRVWIRPMHSASAAFS